MRLGLAGAVLALSLLSACGIGSMFGGEEEVAVEDRSAREIFAQAETELADGNAAEAAKTFDEVERLYPFSQLAKRATIMSAYSNYQAGNMPAARTAANRFLDLYPSDDEAPYAQYLIALTYYDNIVDVGRDQAMTRSALQELQKLVNRYPASDYARDAALKIDLTRNHLAGKEMAVGRYYLKRGHYIAAINRFQTVLQDYQTTAHAPEALLRLVEAYLSLGLNQEAQVAAAVLGENFPGSTWYERAYALLTGKGLEPASRSDSWWDRVYRRVILGEWL